MGDMSKVEMGACAVSLGGADVGHTSGPVLLRVRTLWRPRREEKYGESVVDQVCLGSRVTVTTRFDEKTLANLSRSMPAGEQEAGYLAVGRLPGMRMSTVAAELRLHPLEESGTDKDIVLHSAAAYGPVEIRFEEEKERSFLVVFIGLIDTAQSNTELIARLSHA